MRFVGVIGTQLQMDGRCLFYRGASQPKLATMNVFMDSPGPPLSEGSLDVENRR